MTHESQKIPFEDDICITINICQIPQTLISFDRIDVHDDNPDLPSTGRIVEPSEGLELSIKN